MVFSSVVFIFLFLPLALLLYYIAGKRYRNVILLLVSLLFYFWGEGEYINVMLASIIVNFSVGFLITKYRSYGLLVVGVFLNLLILGYYKYFNFFQQNLSFIFNSSLTLDLDYKKVHLPIGISFFTFQSISYIVDVYRKETIPQKNIFNLALYISLFPQLIAGPIVRYSHIAKEIEIRNENLEDFIAGIQRFIIGLSKKILIANNVAVIADGIFSIPSGSLSTSLAWVGILSYTLQIYFDFSGYSDMAIGLGRMFGFHFEENFNYPYAASSVKDFWRRWHISLSTWFRDYVYIPLGGNKIGNGRTYFNLIFIFFITGLWHGANWTFVIWGLFHGFFLLLERIFFERWLNRTPILFRKSYVILVIMFAWVFFRVEDMSAAFSYICKMLGIGSVSDGKFYVGMYMNNVSLSALIVGCFLSQPLNEAFKKPFPNIRFPLLNLLPNFEKVWLLFCFFLCVVVLSSETYNPFIYFRF
ncbi:MBOAT family protein [Leptospira yasudae]|nr:MBOAT family protein [Leptospira yasudae]